MHLERERGAGTEELAGAFGKPRLLEAGHIAGEEAAEPAAAQQHIQERAVKDEGVMDDAGVAGFDDDRAQPAVGGTGDLDGDIAVVDQAGGGQVLFGDRQDGIGPAEGPIAAGGSGGDGEGIGGGIAAGGAGAGPGVERGGFGGSEGGTVGPDAVAGVGVPRGHPFDEHRLADARGFGGHIGKLGVDVGSDIARGVTRDAPREHDGSDFRGVVGHGGGRKIERDGCGAEYNTRAGGGSGAGDERGDGVGGEVLGGSGERGRVGVVEGAAVGERPRFGVNHENFQLARDTEFGGDELGFVEEDRRGIIEECLLGDQGGSVGGEVGVDLPEGDVGGSPAGAEGAKGTGGLHAAGAAAGGEDEDDGLGGGLVVEFASGARVVGETEIRDEAAGGQTVGRLAGGEHARIERASARVVHGTERWCRERERGSERKESAREPEKDVEERAHWADARKTKADMPNTQWRERGKGEYRPVKRNPCAEGRICSWLKHGGRSVAGPSEVGTSGSSAATGVWLVRRVLGSVKTGRCTQRKGV